MLARAEGVIWPRSTSLLLLVSLGCAWAAGEGVEPIGPAELSAWLSRADAPLVLDVRGRDAYLEGTVGDALDAGTDPAGFLPDSRGGDLVLILPEGALAEPWGTRLSDFHYRVYILAGGLTAWRAAGLPVQSPEESFVRPGTVPFVIPRGLCEMNEPAQAYE